MGMLFQWLSEMVHLLSNIPIWRTLMEILLNKYKLQVFPRVSDQIFSATKAGAVVSNSS